MAEALSLELNTDPRDKYNKGHIARPASMKENAKDLCG